MEYQTLVSIYEDIAATAADTEKTALLADALETTDAELLGPVVLLLQGKLFPSHSDAELGISSSLASDAIAKATGVSEQAIEAQWAETGDLGDVALWAVDNREQQTLFRQALDVQTVFETLREAATYEGNGSQQRRIDAVADLLGDADPNEARWVVRTALGHLRIGIGEGTLRDAIAQALLRDTEENADGRIEAVERAYQVTNDYPVVAETAREHGLDGLDALDVELFRPIDVMLATKAQSLADGIESVAENREDVLAEYKYDGVRAQIHVDGQDVRVFTRRLTEITEQFPDVVQAIRAHVETDRAILEAELVAYDPATGDPVPFQRLSKRIKRKYGVQELAEEVPVTVFLFDLIYEDESLLETPLRERLARLEATIDPEPQVVERARAIEFASAEKDGFQDRAVAFYEDALGAGQEGIMTKNLAATYQPGTRVGYMMKIKPVMEPLDLVVTRAQYSEGRRSEWLGRLFLGAYDPEAEEFREVGRLSTGYTDEELDALTDDLEALVEGQDGRQVQLRPEVVLEVAYEEIQASPEYDSGYALRFPRFEKRRPELAPTDADTVERVERLYEEQ
ncbi:MAG: ATP-dependent DNA ligase [Halorhabdus sp.]